MARSRVELFEQIRRDWRAGEVVDPGAGGAASGAPADGAAGVGQRGPAAAEGVSAAAAAGDRTRMRQVIDGWLLADRDVPRKQRHTARRVWQRLVAEHGAGVAEVTVSRYVARRRVELGLDQVEVAVPQAHRAGRGGRGGLRRVPRRWSPGCW